MAENMEAHLEEKNYHLEEKNYHHWTGNEGEMKKAVDLLRQLLWSPMPKAEVVMECWRTLEEANSAIRGREEDQEVQPEIGRRDGSGRSWNAGNFCGKSSKRILRIGPAGQRCQNEASLNSFASPNCSFASLNRPGHLGWLLAHGHLLGRQLRWAAVFPLPASASSHWLPLLQLVPMPDYPFDRTAGRFWTGRDAWTAADPIEEHPLLGSRQKKRKRVEEDRRGGRVRDEIDDDDENDDDENDDDDGSSIRANVSSLCAAEFEVLLSARRQPWLGQLLVHGRPLLLGIGPLLELLAAAGFAQFGGRPFSIRMMKFSTSAAELPSSGKRWLRTRIEQQEKMAAEEEEEEEATVTVWALDTGKQGQGDQMICQARMQPSPSLSGRLSARVSRQLSGRYDGRKRRGKVVEDWCKSVGRSEAADQAGQFVTGMRMENGRMKVGREDGRREAGRREDGKKSAKKIRREGSEEDAWNQSGSCTAKKAEHSGHQLLLRRLGLSYGPQWSSQRCSIIMSNTVGSPPGSLMKMRTKRSNGRQQFLFNPILLEAIMIEAFSRLDQLPERYENLTNLFASVEVNFERKESDEDLDGNAEADENDANNANDECTFGWDEGPQLVLLVNATGIMGLKSTMRIQLKKGIKEERGRKTGDGQIALMKEKAVGERIERKQQSAPVNSSDSELLARIHRLLCSALPSGQLPADWLDKGLIQMGLDSLALMALAQALNQQFGLGDGKRKRQISPGEVFSANRARDLVELVSERMGTGRGGNVEEKGMKRKQKVKADETRKETRKKTKILEDWKRTGISEEEEANDREEVEEKVENSAEELDEFKLSDNDETLSEEAANCIFELVQQKNLPEKATGEKFEKNSVAISIQILIPNGAIGGVEEFAFFHILGQRKTRSQKKQRLKLKVGGEAHEEFERNVQALLAHLLETNGQEQQQQFLNLKLNMNHLDKKLEQPTWLPPKDDVPNKSTRQLRAVSISLLLLGRALLLHLQSGSDHKIRLQLLSSATAQKKPLLMAFCRVFLQNLQAETGGDARLQLVDEMVREIRFKPWQRSLAPNGLGNGSFEDWAPKGTWLITGGTGGIGLEMARWLASRFGPRLRCLLLLARHRPDSSSSTQFWRHFHQMCRRCPVQLVLGDVADEQRLELALFRRPEMQQLNGVVHSAGLLVNAPVSATDPQAMDRVVRAKAEGAILLDSLLRRHRIQPTHFIVNSSLASIHPSTGQSAYAAANALCDELIRQRRARGEAGTTLNWANWLEVGMAARRPGTNQQLRWLGLPGLRPALALRCFEAALEHRPVQWMVAKFDWPRLRLQKPALWARFEHGIGGELKQRDEVKMKGKEENGEVRRQRWMDPEESNKHQIGFIVQQTLQEQLIGYSKNAKEENATLRSANQESVVDLSPVGFMELGLDSLGLYQFADSLNRRLAPLGVSCSVLDLFEWTNAQKLAEHLCRKMEMTNRLQQMKNVEEKERREFNGKASGQFGRGKEQNGWEEGSGRSRTEVHYEMEERSAGRRSIRMKSSTDGNGAENPGKCQKEVKNHLQGVQGTNRRQMEAEVPQERKKPVELEENAQFPSKIPFAEQLFDHHRLAGRPLVPAALQLRALVQLWVAKEDRGGAEKKGGAEFLQLHNVLFHRKMSPKQWKSLKLVKKVGQGIHCLTDESDAEFCTVGHVKVDADQLALNFSASPPNGPGGRSTEIDMHNFYTTLRANGMDYGPGMRMIGRARIWPNGDDAIDGSSGKRGNATFVRASLNPSSSVPAAGHQQSSSPPLWLLTELALQTLAVGLFHTDSRQAIFLPAAIERFCCRLLGGEEDLEQQQVGEPSPQQIIAIGRVEATNVGDTFVSGSVEVFSESGGKVLLQLDGIWARRLSIGEDVKDEEEDEAFDGRKPQQKDEKNGKNNDEESSNSKWQFEDLMAKKETKSPSQRKKEEKMQQKGQEKTKQSSSSNKETSAQREEEAQPKRPPPWAQIRPSQDMAILAMSGTFSGCDSVEALWHALLEGRQCLSSLDRQVSCPPGLVPVSGICPRFEHFDSALFAGAGLSPAEWRRLDPQIRLLAEHGYAALELSGYAAGTARRAKLRIGCFVGAEPSSPEYTEADEREAARGSLLGMHRRNQHSFCAQWLAHLLGLRGPTVGVYSACSSAFAALAQGRLALLAGEADICLVGAAHLVQPSQIGHQPLAGQPLARSAAQSWPFSSQSTGILRGSAVAVLVLAKANVTLERGDPVLGILRSITLTNDGGQKPSFMAPSMAGQREAVERALAQSGVPREAVAFWECHAAGTALGDSVELQALEGAFFQQHQAELAVDGQAPSSLPRPPPLLLLGSSKASLGHCFAAAGLCSVVKLLQMLGTGLVPPQPLPPSSPAAADLLDPFQGHFAVHADPEPTRLRPTAADWPICVGASCFGIGGTNGALVLMQAPPKQANREGERKEEEDKTEEVEEKSDLSPPSDPPPLISRANNGFQLFPLSAASRNSLKALASKLAVHVEQQMPKDGGSLLPLANSLQQRREHHRFRAFVLANNWAELAQGLRRVAEEDENELGQTIGQTIVELQAVDQRAALAVFFGPQGVQFPGMFAHERRLSPDFLDIQLRQLFTQLSFHQCQQLQRVFDSPNAELAGPAAVQCGLFAVGHAIWAFLRQAIPGIERLPLFFFGHSLGELSALCAAGAFTAEAAMPLLWRRGQLLEQGTAPAKMLLVRHEVGQWPSSYQPPADDGLQLSARLSSRLSTFVGRPAAVQAFLESSSSSSDTIVAKVLDRIGHGFHARAFMSPILEEFRSAAAQMLEWEDNNADDDENDEENDDDKFPLGTVLSNLDGRPLARRRLGPDYLATQMAQPVRLDLCLKTLLRHFPRHRLILEIGPPTMLRQLVREAEQELGMESGGNNIQVISTMRKRNKRSSGSGWQKKVEEAEEEEEPPQLLLAVGQLWQHGFPVDFFRLFGLPSWHWDQQMPGYQFDRAPLNASGEHLLVPFNPSGQGKNNGTAGSNGKNEMAGPSSTNSAGRKHEKMKQKRGRMLTQSHAKAELTKIVAQLWREYLPTNSSTSSSARQTGMDFFEAGGNSLQAAQIVWELERRMHFLEGKLSLELLFQHPTLDDFVEAIWQLKDGAEEKADDEDEQEESENGDEDDDDMEVEGEEKAEGEENADENEQNEDEMEDKRMSAISEENNWEDDDEVNDDNDEKAEEDDTEDDEEEEKASILGEAKDGNAKGNEDYSRDDNDENDARDGNDENDDNDAKDDNDENDEDDARDAKDENDEDDARDAKDDNDDNDENDARDDYDENDDNDARDGNDENDDNDARDGNDENDEDDARDGNDENDEDDARDGNDEDDARDGNDEKDAKDDNDDAGSRSDEEVRDGCKIEVQQPNVMAPLQQLFLPLRSVANPDSIRLHIFCLHPISGSALPYRQLARLLPSWASVVGIQFAGGATKMNSLTELANFYANEILALSLDKPLLLLGHSLGGVLAREVAIALNNQSSANNNNPFCRLVLLFDSWALGQQALLPQKVGKFVADRFCHLAARQRQLLVQGAEKLAEMLRAHQFVECANAPVLWLFRAMRRSKLSFSDFVDRSRDGGWARLTPRLHLVQCAADHEGILAADCLKDHQMTLEAICEQVASAL